MNRAPTLLLRVAVVLGLWLGLLPTSATAVTGEVQVLTSGSTSIYGGEAWGVSGNGRYVLSWTPMEWDPDASPDNDVEDLYIYDRATQLWRWVSPPVSETDDQNAYLPGGSMSSDGSTVVYSYLPDFTGSGFSLVVLDVQTLEQQVYPAASDAAFPSLSADGQVIAYDQVDAACGCPRATVIDRGQEQASTLGPEGSTIGAVSDNGDTVTYRVPRDDGSADWFAHDTRSGDTRPVTAPDGVALVDGRGLHDNAGTILYVPGFDGQTIAIYAIDLTTGANSVVLDGLARPAPVLNDITPDGQFLTLTTGDGLLPEDNNARVDAWGLDRSDGTIVRLNTRADGGQSAERVQDVGVFVPDNHTFATFTSVARDLVEEPLPPSYNLFVKGIGGPIPPVLAEPDRLLDGDPATTERLDVPTPAAAAIAFSRARFSDGGAPYAVISRDDTFADTLAGTVLADGPLLLTPSDALDAPVAQEIARVLPLGSAVYLLGGTSALTDRVATDIEALGLQVRRLSGPTRVETAIAVADAAIDLSGPTTRVGLARADAPSDNPTAAWADSVASGVLSARDGEPTLLTPGQDLHPAVATWLATNGITTTRVFGGSAAISDGVIAEVPGGQRIAGPTRDGTAAAIAAFVADPDAPRRFIIINGFTQDGWAYGLPAAGYAARGEPGGAIPILLVGQEVPASTADLVSACGDSIVDLLVVGSTGTIAQDVVTTLDMLDGSTCG